MEFVSREVVEEISARYSNWGRWGPTDELGTINYITPEKIASAVPLVRRGKIFSLAVPFDINGPQTGEIGRTNPLHVMLQDGGDIASGAQEAIGMQYTDDAVYMVLQCGTQWDALAHFFYNYHMYNGYGPEHVNSNGALKNSICQMANKIMGRAVLVDLPRYKGKPWLDPGEPIYDEDLEGCIARQHVEVGEGDIVLVRTGHIAHMRANGSWGDYVGGPAPGLAVSSAHFFCGRRVAAIATDTWTVEVWPSETPEIRGAMHVILLVHAGITLGEIFDLEELAEDCASDGVYEFFFTAPPLPITGAVGSPINPQVVK